MSALDDYQKAFVDKIAGAIPELYTVEPHYGAFNVDEISRRVLGKASALVALPSLKPGRNFSDGRITFIAEVMVVIIASHDGPPPDGDAAVIARRIEERVMKLAMWQAFGSRALPPTNIAGDELHWDKLDPQGLAMTVVSWEQEILIAADDPFFAKEQALTSDFTFPKLPASAPDDVKTNETARPAALPLREYFDKGIID